MKNITKNLLFKGNLLHDSLMHYTDVKGINNSVKLIKGDTLEFYKDATEEVACIYHNGNNLEYMLEDTPLESIVDACEEIQ